MFLMVGALFCMNDILFPSLIRLFDLSYTAATAIQISFYSVYLIFPLPVAVLIERKGYRYSIIAAMLICSAGCLLFLPAYLSSIFILCLAGLFLLSIGIVVINVAANAYAALLGPPEGSERRINFVQVFSRVGYAVVPVVAVHLIYREGRVHFDTPYLLIMAVLLILVVLMLRSAMPAIKSDAVHSWRFFSLWRQAGLHPKLIGGVVAMFFYVGAEASIAGFFISYLKDVSHFTEEKAALMLSFYNVAASIVGFLAIGLLRVIRAARLVTIFGTMMIVVFILIISINSHANAWLMVLLGGFLGPMFPTLFGMALDKLGSFTNAGAALTSMAIAGGAFFAPLQGLLADRYGVQTSYVVPMGCFVAIVIYALLYRRLGDLRKRAENSVAGTV